MTFFFVNCVHQYRFHCIKTLGFILGMCNCWMDRYHDKDWTLKSHIRRDFHSVTRKFCKTKVVYSNCKFTYKQKTKTKSKCLINYKNLLPCNSHFISKTSKKNWECFMGGQLLNTEFFGFPNFPSCFICPFSINSYIVLLIFFQSIMDSKNWDTIVKIKNKQKKKNWKYFKFVKALSNWNFHNCVCACVCVCVCVWVCREQIIFLKVHETAIKILL